MPLPANNTPWPPKNWQPILGDLKTWETWWTGDPDRLWRHYHAQPTETLGSIVRDRGLFGMAKRLFWGRQTAGAENRPPRGALHIPIAADLCATSADLLYAQPPTLAADGQAGERLEEYANQGLFSTLLDGAETGAVFGGRYHRVTWDPTLGDMPFLSTMDADAALPEFRWGRLVAVTFWTVVHRDGSTVFRHLERHELDQAGNGLIFHGLYEGTGENLGVLMPLTDHPSTAPLAQVIDNEGKVADGITPGLAVEYIPNITPQRRWRTHPQARHYGRSDLDGLEGLMDALDETYSAWMRDIRLGKARIFADRNMLETRDDGMQTFDLDQEVFTPLDGLAGSMKDAVPIQPQQFQIRVAEHKETAHALVKEIVQAARYSHATFGGSDHDVDVTATEVKARQARTGATRDRKIRLEQPALERLLRKMLTVDQAITRAPGLDTDSVSVQFPPLVQADINTNAQTIQTLRGAQVMSLRTAVEMAHPDWDKTSVDQEVAAILKEQPLSTPDDWHVEDGDNDEDADT